RERLRERYEARAAQTLKAIDERNLELQQSPRRKRPAPASRARVPVTAVVLLGLGVLTAVALPSYVLPRVGQDATVTTTDVDAATRLRDLQRAADSDPTPENLMALGDMHLSLQQADEA